MKVLSLFSGIGAFEKALTNMSVNYELVNYCEIDKYASKSYAAIHGVSESKNLGDITKVDTSKLPNDISLLTYGFPCQDISLSGKQKGLKLVCEKCQTEHEITEFEIKKIMRGQAVLCENCGEKLDLTRSGLFFHALRLIEDLKPKVAICENVKNLTCKNFTKEFQIVLESLEEAGYKNYWQVLNAKDYGIPQNRERVFIISIREDIDKGYNFPDPFTLELRLKDMLDAEVDEKYYLKKTLNISTKENYLQWDNSGKGYCSQQDRAYYQDGLCPTLSHCNSNGDKSQVVLSNKSVLVREATKQGYAEAHEGDSINLEQPNSKTRRGRVGHGVSQTLTTAPQIGVVTSAAMRGRYNENGQVEQNIEVSDREISNALTTVQKDSLINENLRIRKLTPKECFRLMGFSDDDFYKAKKVNSNTQLYKQAGNSIVVDVIEEIYEELFNLYWNEVK